MDIVKRGKTRTQLIKLEDNHAVKVLKFKRLIAKSLLKGHRAVKRKITNQ